MCVGRGVHAVFVCREWPCGVRVCGMCKPCVCVHAVWCEIVCSVCKPCVCGVHAMFVYVCVHASMCSCVCVYVEGVCMRVWV